MSDARIGAKVSCPDGWAGTLQHLVRDPRTGQTTHLVIEMTPSQAQATVPVGRVMAVGYDTVFLDLTSGQLRECC